MKTLRLTLATLAASTPGLMAYPFATPQTVGPSSGRVAGVADFNRDGRADILMASDHELVWMRNNGGAAFVEAQSMTFATPTIRTVLTPDIDGDGDTDIVLSTSSPSQLVILRNDGSFVFAKPLQAAMGNAPLEAGVITGDYDYDGDLDAGMYFSANGSSQNQLAWARNDGDAFTVQPSVQVGANSYQRSLTEDFNKDGKMDRAAADSYVRVSFATTAGIASEHSLTGTTGLITQLESGDIDRDGFPDVLVAAGTSATEAQTTGWFRWTGTSFAAMNPIQSHASGRVRGTHLADVDEDGDLDAVFNDQAYYVNSGSQAPQQIMWAENDGSDFGLPKVLFDNTEAWVILSGDVDGDGDTDLVWSENGDVMMSVNNAIHRSAEFGSVWVAGASSPLGDICAADVSGDGKCDFVWTMPGSNAVLARPVDTVQGSGPPSTGTIFSITNNSPGAGAVAAGDLNHDGWSEVVIAATGAGQLQIASRGAATWFLSNAAPLPAGTTELVVADVDHDNNNDIIIGHATGITLLRNTAGTGAGWTTETVMNGTAPVTRICPVQLNGRARMELMAMTEETSPARCRVHRFVWVSGSWTTPAIPWEGDRASSMLAVGDVNRDSAPDVLFAVTGAANCAPGVFGTTSLGTLKPLGSLPPDLRCGEIADFNNDGLPDLVTAGGNTALLALGKGDGTFQSPFPICQDPEVAISRMLVYDFERDGDMDILLLDAAQNRLRVLYNTCGHFDLTELALGSVIPATSSAVPLAMHLDFYHMGRTGDASASIRSLRFRLRKAAWYDGSRVPGDGLTTAEATALLSAVEVYNDAGEIMNFESGTDTMVGSAGPATSLGHLTVTPSPAALPLLTAAPGQTVRLWVRLKMASNANSSAIRSFFLEHITDPAFGGTMVAHAGLTSSNFRLDPMLIDEASPMIMITGALENWRNSHWGQYDGTGTAANDADPDGDGVPNLLEYITGTDPGAGEAAKNAAAALTILPLANSQTPVSLRFVADANALNDPRVRLTVQSSTSLAGWNTVATRVGGGAWTGLAPMSITIDGRTNLLFNTGLKAQTTPKYYVRIKAEEL